jgi:rhamnosyltransferase
LAVREAHGEYVVFLSQDALPYNDSWLENLVNPLINEGVAASYSKQVPYENAMPMEVYFLKTRFSNARRLMKIKSSSHALKLLDVFFSNVSSAARRDIALKHPFQEDLIMSEDQQFSRDLLSKGYAVLYEPASIVWHSHRYSLRTLFQRYFDSAYSLKCIFHQTLGESVKIGGNYYRGEVVEMVTKYPLWLPYYFLYLAAKTSGAVAGHYASYIPRKFVKYLSMHKTFWERPSFNSLS